MHKLSFTQIFSIVSHGYSPADWPDSLKTFVAKSHSLRLNRTTHTCLHAVDVELLLGMTPKKKTEVQSIAHVIYETAQKLGVQHIIDIGGGQGYLSSVLAYQYNLHVVAVDGCDKQTKGGVLRAERIRKLYKSHGKHINLNLSFVTAIVDTHSIDTLIGEIVAGVAENVGFLVVGIHRVDPGLHTCGDLASTIIRYFKCGKHKSRLVALMNMGCCYNTLTDDIGYPLCEGRPALGKNLKMTACQASGRWSDHATLHSAMERLFFRCMLQGVISKSGLPFPSNGKHVKKVGKLNMVTPVLYCRDSFRRLGLPIDQLIPDESIVAYFEENREVVYKQIVCVWALRTLLSEPVESIILLDRLEYLKEFDTKLVALVDACDSPRNMCLISSRFSVD